MSDRVRFGPNYRVCPTCEGEGLLFPFAPDVTSRGRRLKAAIVGVGLTQEQFAEQVGISPKHLSQLINGATEGTIDVWQRIDQALLAA